jgi:excisionase family DNA binding protein
MAMTAREAAKAWNVSQTTVLRWIRNGRLVVGKDVRLEETPMGNFYVITRRDPPPIPLSSYAPIQRSSGGESEQIEPPPPGDDG